MNACAAWGRVAAAVVLAMAGLSLGLRRRGGRGPAPIPVARCPIHGIAYDAELEVCPDCVKTDAAGGKGDAR
ncbi:MAG: hypothetical protein ACREKQ_01000 [Candidatus Rokuibacteriota bacterium]